MKGPGPNSAICEKEEVLEIMPGTLFAGTPGERTFCGKYSGRNNRIIAKIFEVKPNFIHFSGNSSP
jgi:hypothetical protein